MEMETTPQPVGTTQSPPQIGQTIEKLPKSGLAIASLILGIVSFIPLLGVLTGIIAIIVGAIGLSKIKKGGVGGKNLANEYAWITREWRDRARNVADKAGFETKVIYIKVDPQEIKQRWLENSKTKARFHWPEEEFKSYLKDFEEPTEDENIIVYNQSMPVDEWIKQSFQK